MADDRRFVWVGDSVGWNRAAIADVQRHISSGNPIPEDALARAVDGFALVVAAGDRNADTLNQHVFTPAYDPWHVVPVLLGDDALRSGWSRELAEQSKSVVSRLTLDAIRAAAIYCDVAWAGRQEAEIALGIYQWVRLCLQP